MEYWNNLWKKSFDVRGYRITLHLIFWLLYFIGFSFYTYYVLVITNWEGEGLAINWLISMFLNIGIIGFNYYLTVGTTYRYLVKHRHYNKFFISLILNLLLFCGLIIGAKILKSEVLPLLGIENPNHYDIFESMKNRLFFFALQLMVAYFSFLCVPVAAKFFRDQLRHKQRENALEKQNLQMQMDFLKAQIHPHFLFNTLNNIYSLNLNAQSEKASEMISRLAALLRYVLYKGKAEFISLRNEMQMLQDFIQLEHIRSDNLELIFNVPEQIEEQIYLPPFLLLPLVENAFKHGVNSQLDAAFIRIDLKIGAEDITLAVCNNFDDDYRKTNASGLGLANLRKRLNYYYPQCHSLKLSEHNNQFTATLKIPIKCPKYSA